MLCAVAGMQNATAATSENGGWATFILTGPVGTTEKKSRWYWWLDGQYRYLDTDSNPRQAVIRPAIGFAANDTLKLWAGYAYLQLRISNVGTADEHRLYQDAIWRLKAGSNSTVMLRSRIEERWIERFSDVGWRFRQLAMLQRPFNFNSKFSAILSEELLISLNDTDWGERSGFDQNRLFIGIGYQLNPIASLQVGYQNQYIDNVRGSDLMNNLAMLGVNFNFK